jgi:hypothetical protein
MAEEAVTDDCKAPRGFTVPEDTVPGDAIYEFPWDGDTLPLQLPNTADTAHTR